MPEKSARKPLSAREWRQLWNQVINQTVSWSLAEKERLINQEKKRRSESMPKKLAGKKLTAREHRQWKHVHDSTGSGAAATAAVKKSRRKKASKK